MNFMEFHGIPWGRKESDTTERLLLSYREEQPKKKKTFAFIVSLIKTTVI